MLPHSNLAMIPEKGARLILEIQGTISKLAFWKYSDVVGGNEARPFRVFLIMRKILNCILHSTESQKATRKEV